jgi:Plasmid pRiA4b ORF-3-like protein
MARTPRATTRVVYQIKVTLKGSKPPIWRRMQITSETTLAKLHRILQRVMGWEGSHLYQFVTGGIAYGDPSMLGEWNAEDARTVTLAALMRSGKSKLLYEYDFGESWEHELLVEKILPLDEGKRYPVCLTGKRACPPEDCGGVWGYVSVLEALHDPEHPEHEEMLEWIGGAFDPEAFNRDEVNVALQHLTASEVRRRPR